MSHRTRLNKALGRFGSLKNNSFRYKLVQFIGYALWGRKLGYLSWWPHAARSAGVILVNNGRIVLGRRSSLMNEGAGKYSVIGGFVDPGETYAEGVVREIYEETSVRMDVALFQRTPDMLRELHVSIREQYDMDLTAFYYVQAISDADLAKLTLNEEVDDFVVVTEAEYRALVQADMLAFPNEVSIIDEAFAKNLIV